MIEKFTQINETILDCLNEKNEIKIVQSFTEIGVKILDADFGFVWLKESMSKKWKLVYRTSNLPFHPRKPRLAGMNYQAMTSGKIEYIEKFKNTPSDSHTERYIKSLVIIPMFYKKKTYGTIVICFKRSQSFSKEKKILSTFLGNGIAQVMTIHRSHERAEKLKETEILLAQEKSKTEFMANAAHELRTPLAIMRGTVELALQEKKENKNLKSTQAALKSVQGEIVQLSEILSNLVLLTSKAGYQKNIIHFTEVDIISLITQIIKRLRVSLKKKNIKVKFNIYKDKTIFIGGDKQYLEKLFINLVRNAIIYGREGGEIIISLKNEKNKVIVKVRDNGIGISKKDLPHIFKRFYRSEQAWITTTIGTGLGLSIVKWIVKIHGGDISVKSKLNRGSVFTVTLPKNLVSM